MTSEEARQLLTLADVFYMDDDPDEPRPGLNQTLNMNDTWGWATAWGQYVSDEELPTVGELFRMYGLCGLYYWMSTKHDNMRSEFEDINRFVEFVRREQQLVKEIPSSSERAYKQYIYTLGQKP